MRSLLLILMFLFVPFAQAQEMTLVQVESQLEQRLLGLVHLYDSEARVIVKASIRTDRAVLPGLSYDDMDIYGSGLMRGMTYDEVASLDVTILSQYDELPAWIKNEMNQMMNFKSVKVKLRIKKVTELTSGGSALGRFLPQLDGMFRKIFFAILGALLAGAILFFIYLLQIPKILDKAVQKLIQGITEISGRREPELAKAAPEARSDVAAESGLRLDSQSNLNGLSIASVTALFADSYWSEKDQYAAWLWTKLEKSQKEELLKVLPYAYAYSIYLNKLEPQVRNFHEHPYYLNPFNLSLISNLDFEKWLNQQKTLPKVLSPIRLSQVQIPLKNRLQWLENKTENTNLTPMPQPSIEFRQLPMRLGEMRLSLDDENYLIENHEQVPKEYRNEIVSLTWLWLEAPAIQEQILADYSAEDLAGAWVGPEVVLKDLLSQMPERKQKLMTEMAANITPNRQSWVLADINSKVMKLADQKTNSSRAA